MNAQQMLEQLSAETARQRTEYYDGRGRSELRVAHGIQRIVSIHDDMDREWPESTQLVDGAFWWKGRMDSLGFRRPLQDGTRNVRVVYIAAPKDSQPLDHEFTIASHGGELVWHTTEPTLHCYKPSARDRHETGERDSYEFDSDDEIDTGDIMGAIQNAVKLGDWQTAQVRIRVEIVEAAWGPNFAADGSRDEYDPMEVRHGC